VALESSLAEARESRTAQRSDVQALESSLTSARAERAALAAQLRARESELSQALAAASVRRAEADRLETPPAGRGEPSVGATASPTVGSGAPAGGGLAGGAVLAAGVAGAAVGTAAAGGTGGGGLPAPAAVATRHRVTDVRFSDEAERTRIFLQVQGGRPVWRVLREGPRARVLEVDGARIDPALERSLDTAEFPSAVQLVSSFQAPPPGERVRVAVTLSAAVEEQVSFSNGQLVWTFQKPASGAVARGVGLPPPPPTYGARATAAGGGAASRGGAGAGPVGFDTPRAAAYLGMAQSAGAAEVTGQRRARRVRKQYVGRKINIDIKDGDIHNILRLLAKEGNVNIVTSDDVKGSVTLHLQSVPWDQALDIILRTKGLDMVREGDIIRVAPAEHIAKEREALVERNKVQEQLKPLKVRLMTVNHARAAELQKSVGTVLSSRGKADFDKRTNTLIIRDVDDHLEAAVDLVRRLDTQTSQVLLTARIVEVNTNDLMELGIQWGGRGMVAPSLGNQTGLRFPSHIGISGGADDQQIPATGVQAVPNFVVNLPAAVGGGSGGALGLTFGSVDGAFNLNVRLSALQNRGTAKIISQPRIATLDNVQATIKDGVRIPISQVSAAGIQTQFFNADLQLQATPQVTQDGNIYLKMKVTKATPDFQNVGARGDPTILTKEAQTELLLADGETMVIGGIFTSNVGSAYAEVPYLARIPILGALFRRYREDVRKSELLIFVTTSLMNRREAAVQTGP
jgi:type IV pilus assembly protein PilQ